MAGGICAGELHAARRQSIGVTRRSPSFNGLLPFRFEIALRLQTDQKRIERAGLHISKPCQFIAVGPSATGIEQDGKDHPGMGRKCACSGHVR